MLRTERRGNPQRAYAEKKVALPNSMKRSLVEDATNLQRVKEKSNLASIKKYQSSANSHLQTMWYMSN